MSTYVMSDIHGCFSAFQKMLEKIGFSENDNLIIAGDIIDRGPENFEMLTWFESKPANVEILMGNHEYDFAFEYVPALMERIDPFEQKDSFKGAYIDPYYDPYGTIRELKNKRGVTPGHLSYWAGLMQHLPYYKILNVNGKRVIIVHASYISPKRYKERYGTLVGIEREYVWNRYAYTYDEGTGDTIIFGHTPTISAEGYFADGNVFRKEYKGNTFIDIDCGYVHRERFPNAKMAAIRLEDEEVFYL